MAIYLCVNANGKYLITDLLDDYNLFLYNGQEQQIRKLRKSMGLTQYEFGKLYGVNRRTIERWENEKVQIFKSTWKSCSNSKYPAGIVW